MSKAVNAIRIAPAKDVQLEQLNYRYPMRSALVLEAEIRQIEECKRHGFPSVKLQPLRDDWVSIVGYGPSLAETWREISRPCVSVSGAHDYLIERGITPDFHVECDGRDHKTKHLERPNEQTVYLMATICNPLMWQQLRGHNVKVWHNANGQHVLDWIGANDDGGLLVAGGSVVGLSAIHLMGIYGFRRFRLFGFDGNFRGKTRHAGPHYGPPQKIIKYTAKGREWATSPQMINACEELRSLALNQSLEFEVYGDCLLGAMI